MKHSSAGFTLIEVTVAIALVVLVFGGLMTILLLSQDVKQVIRYDLIAQNLAKEGLELTRYKRDKNYNDAYPGVADPFTDMYDLDSGSEIYSFIIDTNLNITPVATGVTVMSSPPLKIFGSEYGYSTDPNAVSTVFRRLITTTYDPSATPPTLKVLVEVYWESDTKKKIISVEEELTDWRF